MPHTVIDTDAPIVPTIPAGCFSVLRASTKFYIAPVLGDPNTFQVWEHPINADTDLTYSEHTLDEIKARYNAWVFPRAGHSIPTLAEQDHALADYIGAVGWYGPLADTSYDTDTKEGRA